MRKLPAILAFLLTAAACTPVSTTRVDRDLTQHIDSGALSGQALADAYVDRGTLRLLNDDIDPAIADFDAALAAAPDHVSALVWRGQARDAKGDDAAAMTDFNRAIALAPDTWPAYGARGLLLARRNQTDKALADLAEAVRLGKGHESEFLIAHSTLTPVEVMNPKGPSVSGTARSEFMLRADHYLSYIHAVRGGLLLDQNSLDEALIDLNEAIRLNPESPRALWNLGLAELASGRCKEGVQDLRKAETLVFNVPPPYMSADRNRAFVAKTPCSDILH